MSTTAPDVTIDTTIGQIITPATATPTSTSISTSSPTALPIATPTGSSSPTIGPRLFIDRSLVIYGYGPINSEVYLTGFGISQKTDSLPNGYFSFNKIYSYSLTYPEVCIQAKDSNGLITQPTCIPALPVNNFVPNMIGPVLLSPTITLSNNNIVVNNEVIVSGNTIPNTNIIVYVTNNYFLPIYQITSDYNGRYEFSFIPSVSDSYKMFSIGKVGEDLTNKSTILGLNTISEVSSKAFSLKEFILENKISLLIILELLIIMILGIMVLKAPTRRKIS